MLKAVTDIVQWTAGAEPDDIFAVYVEKVTQAFSTRLARASASCSDRRTTALVDSADAAMIWRIMTAPQTFWILAQREDLDDFSDYVCSAVRAELARWHGLADDKPLWTVVGDFRAAQRSQAAYRAPTVSGIPVDFISPYGDDHDIPVNGPRLEFAPAERESLTDKIDSAMRVIAGTASPAYRLVVMYTRVIVVRRDLSNHFMSASSPRFVGRAVLVNPDHASTLLLAESLVHEAIHALLCAVAVHHPYVLDHQKLAAVSVVSPWTGNRISMDAFLDACFVWFGLRNFWRGFGTHGEPTNEVQRLLGRAEAGFHVAPITTMLRGAEPWVSQEVLIELQRIDRETRLVQTGGPP